MNYLSTAKYSHIVAAALCSVVITGATHAQVTNLHDFNGTDGRRPEGVAVSGSTVFGTAHNGGANDSGTLWSFDTSASTFTNLYDFDGGSGQRWPAGDIAVSGMKVFGTATHFNCGLSSCGTIWSFDISTNAFNNLYNLDVVTDGHNLGGVAVSGTTVFGTARRGGANHSGTLWSFDTSTSTFTKLYDFARAADGADPDGSIALSGTTIFGTTPVGGANGHGTLWSFDTSASTFTNLYDGFFSKTRPGDNVLISGSTIFGTTGGFRTEGTLWSFDTSTNTFATLHDLPFFPTFLESPTTTHHIAISGSTIFGVTNIDGANVDCENPTILPAPPIIPCGTLWSFDTSTNTFTNLHDFDRVPDGGFPNIIELSGTTIFGTASTGGANDDDGTLWSFAVPEPASYTLGAMCLCALLGYRAGVIAPVRQPSLQSSPTFLEVPTIDRLTTIGDADDVGHGCVSLRT